MNEQYLNRMHSYLQTEMPAYIESLNQAMMKGISINLLKSNSEEIKQVLPVEITQSPFNDTSYRIPADSKLGNHWTHSCGLYYIQEPSAASVVDILDVQEKDWVLDLCAAPGGKSSQIASRLNNTGLLVSNEIDSKRAQILLSNLERLGVSENMITSLSPTILCPQVQGWFDKVLVDAPCSGEGMMKKHEMATLEWNQKNVEACAQRQSEILDLASLTLKQNGILVYSTCTYAIEENEQVIMRFLQRHPDFELLDAGDSIKRKGLPLAGFDSDKVRRIFPMDGGEGHFVAKLRKTSSGERSAIREIKNSKIDECCLSFMKEQIDCSLYTYKLKDKIYAKRSPFIQIEGIIRQGMCVGEVIKNRFEPHHAFYMNAYLCNHFLRSYELSDEQVPIYLSGNVLIKDMKGFVAITYHQHVLGFGKGDGAQIKNKYPKGLRVQS